MLEQVDNENNSDSIKTASINPLLFFFPYFDPEDVDENRGQAGSDDSKDTHSIRSPDAYLEENSSRSDVIQKQPTSVDPQKLRMNIRLPRHPKNYSPIKDASQLCISFSGCGFLGAYEFGAAKMIVEHGKEVMARTSRLAGCSAGSLISTLLVFAPDKVAEAVELMYRLAEDVNSLPFGAMTPGFVMSTRLRRIVEEYVPEDVSKANGKLFISVTVVKTWNNYLVSKYNSRKDLIDTLLASCYHPMWSSGILGKTPIVNDQACIDGGYTNNMPEFNDVRTISITPFAGDADVCPEDSDIGLNDSMYPLFKQNINVSISNMKRLANTLFPPSSRILRRYFEEGAADAEKMLKSHGMYND